MLKIDITDYNEHFLQKIKRLVLPLLVDLLSSRESESKAGGLNILGSLCGLSYDFTNPWYKINDNLNFFKRNTKYVSLPIWQFVFNLQEDWDITIKEASAVLIQLCAPRESIRHFYKVKREGENLRLKVLLNNFAAGSIDVAARFQQIMNYITNNAREGSSVKSDRNLAQDASEYANQSRSSNHDDVLAGKQVHKAEEEKKLTPDQKKFLEEKVKEVHSSSSIYDEEVRAYNRTDPRQQEEGFMREEFIFEFYVDEYSDDKIKEIISIFRNDFKPPKNLWIENMNVQANSDINYFNDVFADDDTYNQSEEHSPNIADISHHNQEIDDIGYEISDLEKSKSNKSKTKKVIEEQKVPEPKPVEPVKPKVEEIKEETKYNDRIKQITEENIEPDASINQEKKSLEKKTEKDANKAPKVKKKKSTDKQPENEIKITKAKDGLNIEINDSGLADMGKNSGRQKASEVSKNTTKKGGQTGKNLTPKAEDFNKTQKFSPNVLNELDLEHIDENEDVNKPKNGNKDENSRSKLTKEAEDQINRQLRMIEDDKARRDLEKASKKKKEEKKSSRSKNRQNTGQKSSREGYFKDKKKRPHSHKKRGSASTMQELKKKMGWANSHTSRGRTGGEKFLNYSLDEINQKFQNGYNTTTNKSHEKGVKKRLNKSFENVFSACASTSRAKTNFRKNKKLKKKPISSSPRRMSAREKKSSLNQAKTPNTTSRKRLAGSLFGSKNNTAYNAKELADKLCLINFSSMPSTPTGNTFIKKLGEKMNILKAEKEKMIYNFCKKQLSMTSPNMGAILRAIVPNEKKVKNLKLKANDTSYLNSSGILSSRNAKEERIINSSRQNEHFSFGSANENLKPKRHHKGKKKEPMTERLN